MKSTPIRNNRGYVAAVTTNSIMSIINHFTGTMVAIKRSHHSCGDRTVEITMRSSEEGAEFSFNSTPAGAKDLAEVITGHLQQTYEDQRKEYLKTVPSIVRLFRENFPHHHTVEIRRDRYSNLFSIYANSDSPLAGYSTFSQILKTSELKELFEYGHDVTEDLLEEKSFWKHHNGNTYKVLHMTNIESTNQDKYPTTVVYANTKNGRIYSRRLCDWHRSFVEVEEWLEIVQ